MEAPVAVVHTEPLGDGIDRALHACHKPVDIEAVPPDAN
jgi:hypothetical protein